MFGGHSPWLKLLLLFFVPSFCGIFIKKKSNHFIASQQYNKKISNKKPPVMWVVFSFSNIVLILPVTHKCFLRIYYLLPINNSLESNIQNRSDAICLVNWLGIYSLIAFVFSHYILISIPYIKIRDFGRKISYCSFWTTIKLIQIWEAVCVLPDR